MTTLAELKAISDDNISSNEKVLASNAALKTQIASLEAQLTSAPLSQADQATVDGIAAALQAETAKNAAA